MVGDRWRDIEAGRRAGCRTVLIQAGYDERQADDPDMLAGSLFEASTWICSDSKLSGRNG
jgi:D-glycero-D-manno-heptose 1,7-bisphosphate phosphatase